MGWIHDTGYEPAYAHEGYTLTVLDDGTETATWPLPPQRTATGWRAGCDCGWRGTTLYRVQDWPDAQPAGWAPDAVDGWDTGGGCHAEWGTHLHAALPELAVHDAAARAAAARTQLDAAVATARTAGTPWARIAAAADMSRQAAHERWAGSDARTQ